MPFQLRSGDEFADLAFGGLAMVDPGMVLVSDWRPVDKDLRPVPAEVGINGAVAMKP